MEPEDVAEYSQRDYWEQRYNSEDEYNWFPSVHNAAVTAICRELAAAFQRRDGEGRQVLRVLHLGTGSSSLCMDLYTAVCACGLPFTLEQVAMDYAPNVIEKMRVKYAPEVLPNVQWVVGDVRRLEEFHTLGPFDAVIDKGTMDALEADKNSETLADDVEAMLRGVDALLAHAKGYGVFMQITWVVPYIRLHYTKGARFVWGDQVRHAPLEDNDMYRLFVYTVRE